MATFIETLLHYELPIDIWVLAAIWLVLFLTVHLLNRSGQAAVQSQKHIVLETNSVLTHGAEPKFVLGQAVFASLIFTASLFLGEPFQSFFVGGLVVAITFSLGLQIHHLFFHRGLAREGSARGSVTLSASFAPFSAGQRLLGVALACLVLGLVFADVALLGGTVILASSGIGYLRKARRVQVQL